MEPQPPPDDPLVAHLSGKRSFVRVSAVHELTLRSTRGTWRARTLDISLGGLLLLVEDPDFYVDGETGFDAVNRAFPEGLEVGFDDTGSNHEAVVVRITVQKDGLLSLGCRFARPLESFEAALLGVSPRQVEEPEAALPSLPLCVKQNAPLAVLVFAAQEEILGPRYLATVERAGERTLDARLKLPAGTARDVARRLAKEPFPIAVVRGMSRLWEGEAQLVSCRHENGQGIAVRLLAAHPLGRAVERCLEAATTA